MSSLLLKNNKTKFRLLGFNPSFGIRTYFKFFKTVFDSLILKSIGNDWETLGFIKSFYRLNNTKYHSISYYFSRLIGGFWWILRSFPTITRVRGDLVEFSGIRKFVYTIKKVGFCWILKGFLSNRRVRESLMISANI